MIDTIIKLVIGMLLMLFVLVAVASIGTGSKYKPTHDMPVFAVYVEVVPRMFVNQRCQEIMKSATTDIDVEGALLEGCASWIVETQKCHIVVPAPITSEGFVNERMLAIWGHEILHCTKGSFHD